MLHDYAAGFSTQEFLDLKSKIGSHTAISLKTYRALLEKISWESHVKFREAPDFTAIWFFSASLQFYMSITVRVKEGMGKGGGGDGIWNYCEQKLKVAEIS